MAPLTAALSRDTHECLARARLHYRSCHLCEHRCGVNREAGERGPCKAGATANVFRQRVEYGDERELAPSHLFYLSGCDLRCAFCINELNAFDPKRGETLTPGYFRQALRDSKHLRPKTLQWVGGEPTIHLPAILEALAGCDELPRVVWKTDLHATPEALALLAGRVDVFLADFKFGNDDCARRIARVDNYLAILGRNLRMVASQADLIIRHLLLPGHLECCFRPITDWIVRHLPHAKVSVRDGYLPHWQASRHPELAQPLKLGEARVARQIALDAGLRVIH